MDSSYGTVTVTDVPLTTAMTYITIVNTTTLNTDFNLDNIIVTAAAIPPTMTSTGVDDDWTNADTWTVSGTPATVPSTTPTAEYDVVINHNVEIPSSFGAAATAKSITVNTGIDFELRQNNTLTVTNDIALGKSDNGMIIYNQSGNFPTVTLGGTFLAGKKATIVKRLDDNKWTLVSAGLSNSKYSKTFGDSRNETVFEDPKYAFGSYNVLNDTYTYLATGYDTNGVWGSGIGWATKSNDGSGSDVVFMGDFHEDDVPVTLTDQGFNLVGNPYPTYLYGNDDTTDATNNVLTVNNGILVEPTLWFWDSTNETWITENQESGAYHINPVQGFFVKTNAPGTSFSFTEAMQTHTSNSDTFLKTSENKFSIDLSIETQKRTTRTLINYSENATTSFEKGYDSSTFGGYASEFQVYTEMLESTDGKKLAIQSLPNTNFEDMIIPVGLNAAANSEITFSAEALNVPSGYKVFLEDRLNNTFIRLDEVNAKYVTTVTDAITEGRFYLHTRSSALSTDSELLNSVSIYKSDAATLRIVGLSQGKASVKLYNVLGKQVMSSSFNANGVKELSLPRLSKGVYIVQLETATGKLNKKIVLE
jgi:hypothetical protein